MVVADKKQSLTITGNGDVLEPHDGVIGARSGASPCALSRRRCWTFGLQFELSSALQPCEHAPGLV
jgi:hypothetical protein